MDDLDIDNYTMDDILKLFKMTNFDEADMKRAKKMVLKSHPDKSHLPSEYFYFYSKAYRILYSIYEFKNKLCREQSTEYVPNNIETSVSEYLKTMDPGSFASWFNKEFDKRREETEGYDEWFKSDEGLITTNIKFSEMNHFFEENAVCIKSDIQECGLSSDVFSYYSDLKEAHTLAPVSMNEYYNKPKYTIDEYKNHRQQEESSNVPYDEKKSKTILSEKNKLEEEESIARAYYYAKKTQEAKKANDALLAKMKLLK